MKNSKKSISLFMALIISLSCVITAFAEGPKVIKQPDRTSFYQGIDWSYSKSNTIMLNNSDLDLTGTVISAGEKTITYSDSGKFPNMYASPESGAWSVGENSIKIGGDDFSGYAYTKVKFVEIKSISIITPQTRTYLLLDKDWKLGPLGDVEYTDYNLTGLKIKAVYADGTSKTISYSTNKLISMTVPAGVDTLYPGNATFYITFCGKQAPVELTFAKTLPYALGDVSKDGKINSYDALDILKHSIELVQLDSLSRTLADINGDYKVNSTDALAVLKYSVGLINKF